MLKTREMLEFSRDIWFGYLMAAEGSKRAVLVKYACARGLAKI